ncbi:MAG: flavodoxin [Agathobaculum sp.]
MSCTWARKRPAASCFPSGRPIRIQTTDPYPETYDATIELAQEENTEGARPALATHIENLDAYDTVFLGFPNWWSDMPMALYSFLEEYDFSGKTIVPSVTSGGSGFSGALDTIAELQPDAAVLDGLRISGSSAADAQAEVTSWLADLGFTE